MSVRANLAGLFHRLGDWFEPRTDMLPFGLHAYADACVALKVEQDSEIDDAMQTWLYRDAVNVLKTQVCNRHRYTGQIGCPACSRERQNFEPATLNRPGIKNRKLASVPK
jgi:hypothetical protein